MKTHVSQRDLRRIALAVIGCVGLILGLMPGLAGAAETFTCEGRPATIVGSSGDDVLIGTSGPDVIVGLDGNDIIRGLDGDDILCGDNGRDRLFGGRGRDELFGGKKNDILRGDGGADWLHGERGIDRVFGGPGADVIFGGSGTRDRLFGKGGVDHCVDPQLGTTTRDGCENWSRSMGSMPPAIDLRAATPATGSRCASKDRVVKCDVELSAFNFAEGFYVGPDWLDNGELGSTAGALSFNVCPDLVTPRTDNARPCLNVGPSYGLAADERVAMVALVSPGSHCAWADAIVAILERDATEIVMAGERSTPVCFTVSKSGDVSQV